MKESISTIGWTQRFTTSVCKQTSAQIYVLSCIYTVGIVICVEKLKRNEKWEGLFVVYGNCWRLLTCNSNWKWILETIEYFLLILILFWKKLSGLLWNVYIIWSTYLCWGNWLVILQNVVFFLIVHSADKKHITRLFFSKNFSYISWVNTAEYGCRTQTSIHNCFSFLLIIVINLESYEKHYIATNHWANVFLVNGTIGYYISTWWSLHILYKLGQNHFNGKMSLLKSIRTSLIAVAKIVVHLFWLRATTVDDC